MEQSIFQTKNYIIYNLGEVEYEDVGYCCNQYMVHVKNINCLDILFEFEGYRLEGVMPWDQNNKTSEGQEMTDFSWEIAKLIENDVIGIVKFMDKHL